MGEKNYAYWKSQIFPALRAYELEGLVTGEKPCPSPFISQKLDDSGKFVEQSNSEYTLWKKLDQFLVSWLISSISETMFRHIATCETAYDIWHTLEMHFLTDSKARVLHLRNLLQTTRKENLSINDYILKMKEFAGSLTASGVNISDEELLLYVLDGLGPEYDAVVANLTSRSGLARSTVPFT